VPVEVKAYVDGKVTEIIPDEGVVVEARASLVQGIFGLAGEVSGSIAVVAQRPEDVVEPAHIRPEHKGRILVGGSRLTLPAFARAVDLGVAGIVCGGFEYHDLHALLGRELGVAVTGGEALGTTLMVTEGFGKIAMAAATHELLVACEGRHASMTGATQIRAGVIRPEIVIPGKGPVSSRAAQAPAEGLSVGARVRCVRAPYFGRLGTVVALPVQPARLPSESTARVVEVALAGSEAESETLIVPRANVELIER